MKYKLLGGETVYVSRQGNIPRMETMYRIQAVKSIPRHGVNPGDIGGFVSSSGVLSHQGDCWIAKDAKACGNVQVLDNALLTDFARVVTKSGCAKKIVVSGNAKVRDNAFIGLDNLPTAVAASLITGDADISGFVSLHSPCVVEGKSVLYGNASFGLHCSVLQNARVGGDVKVEEGVVIAGNSRAYGEVIIASNAEVSGDTILSANTRIYSGQRVHNSVTPLYPDPEPWEGNETSVSEYETWMDDDELWGEEEEELQWRENSDGSITSTPGPKSKPKPISRDSVYTDLFAELKEKFDAYHSDVINLLRFPVMSDMTNEYTRAMVTSMRKAERAMKLNDEAEIKETVLEFEECFLAAESNARRIASTLFSPEDKKKTETAINMFNKATDEASTEPEKKISLRRAFKELEGVMDVPETARIAIVAKAGLLELEA